MKTILFIDWENFKKKLETVFKKERIENKPKWHEYNFPGLFNQALQGIEVDKKIFYVVKLNIHLFSQLLSR